MYTIPYSLRIIILSAAAASLLSCAGKSTKPDLSHQDGPPAEQVNVAEIPDAVVQHTQRSKYGNPSSYVVFGKRYYVMSSGKAYKEQGIASWYGSKFHGRRTSSGEPYDMHAMTAAHKTLPLPSYVRVTNLKNGRQVIVKVNDRGPFHENRIIDLSHTAAVKLGIKATGTGHVEVKALTLDTASATTKSADSKIKEHSPAASLQSPIPVTLQNKADLYLQLGAFSQPQNAHNLKLKLSSDIATDKLHISDTLKNNQPFYRVRIGPVKSIARADELSKILTQKGFQEPLIIIE